MLATRHRSVRVVKSLLTRNDLDPNIANSYGDHVLHFSVFLGRAIVKSLLDHPANVNPNVVGGNGLNRTALMEACVAAWQGSWAWYSSFWRRKVSKLTCRIAQAAPLSA